MMPLLNKFKRTLMDAFFSFEDELTAERINKFYFSLDEMKLMFFPQIRVKMDEKIIRKTLDDMNTSDLHDQYSEYMNSLNLLTYDKIKQNFVQFNEKFGIRQSSESPDKECEELHIRDVVRDYKREVMERSGPLDMEEEKEFECIRKWKLYDDIFHNIFYNNDSQQIVIKKKTASSPSDENNFREFIENELVRVVNYFVPTRMKDQLEHWSGDIKLNLEMCGVLELYSQNACF